MSATFLRSYGYPRAVKTAIKAAKELGLRPVSMTAKGAWRSLHPNAQTGQYEDIEGPFPVRQGVGPAFLKDDGSEWFMVDDTARVVVVFEETP